MFTRALDLPLTGAVVIGTVFYAAPTAAAPLRLRISLSPTIRQGEFNGLRLAAIHPDHGQIDTAHLAFADHGTFTARDERLRAEHRTHIQPGTVRQDAPEPDWAQGDFTALQTAVAQYVRMWFNTSIPPLTPPRRRPRTVTALPAPAADHEPGRSR
ncbi:hypothetical protein [Streptomyces sp. HPF1205]|uniref:hypothetical protein n=1 Tax=Streptomyces sp. HPF1205 TaxID=2873262 RepID=UPI001CEC997C|nr:hypothetical protein [Streptomyces sp. HPF1205]